MKRRNFLKKSIAAASIVGSIGTGREEDCATAWFLQHRSREPG
jgi:hypothetical protein